MKEGGVSPRSTFPSSHSHFPCPSVSCFSLCPRRYLEEAGAEGSNVLGLIVGGHNHRQLLYHLLSEGETVKQQAEAKQSKRERERVRERERGSERRAREAGGSKESESVLPTSLCTQTQQSQQTNGSLAFADDDEEFVGGKRWWVSA